MDTHMSKLKSIVIDLSTCYPQMHSFIATVVRLEKLYRQVAKIQLTLIRLLLSWTMLLLLIKTRQVGNDNDGFATKELLQLF